MSYHLPVLLHECIDGLNIKSDGIYVDVTFGGGGHSREILQHLTTGHLYGFDQDPDAEANIPDSDNFTLVQANFRHLKRYLRLHGVRKIDGLLADLGISSHQIDVGERGFSTRFDGPLDMRMSQSGPSAADVLNTYDAQQLQLIFSRFGEVRNARTLAQAIVQQRTQQPFDTIADLKQVAKPLSRGNDMRYLAQVFQAIRIEVNDEMGALHDLLEQAAEVMSPDGRLVFLTYHSLEDRPVKNYFRHGTIDNEPIKDAYGNYDCPLKPVNKKPILATPEEVKLNSRARSAKLRIAKKLDQ